MSNPRTHGERIVVLETQSDQAIKERAAILKELEDHRQETKLSQESINAKLDELLALRNKGIGAFWLATSLAGAGAISVIVQIIHWVRIKFGA